MNGSEHKAAGIAESERDRQWAYLMASAQNGDMRAYAALLNDVLPMLRAVVHYRHRGFDGVEDIVQDILLSVHRVRHTYDPSRSFRAWLLTIARRRSIDALRVRGRVRRHEETRAPEDLDRIVAVPADEPAHAEYEAALTHAIARLPAGQRRAIELVKLREMSFAEASAHSGVSVSALKVSVHRAMKALRTYLKRV